MTEIIGNSAYIVKGRLLLAEKPDALAYMFGGEEPVRLRCD